MIGFIGLIFIIIAPFYIYRTAKQNGHNAIFWALIAVGAGFGIQIGIPLLAGIIIGIVYLISGYSEENIRGAFSGLSFVIGWVCMILSIVGILLIMRKVSSISEGESFMPPPPPNSFNLND